MHVPFHKMHLTGEEIVNVGQALSSGWVKGDGAFTQRCQQWLEKQTGCSKVLLTTSATTGLEMAAVLCDISPGDEVIMPSFTFPSTANAFLLRGAKVVFSDVRPDTLNLDETQLESLITPNTKAICPVHYAGVACEMDTINTIARKHGLFVVEDAAQGVMASYKGRALGTLSDLGVFSFHESKNYSAGEGGALLVNNGEFSDRAEWIREKGTNRRAFLRGEVDKYSWVDIGGSYLPSELNAAVLYAQLNHAEEINRERRAIWYRYIEALSDLEDSGDLSLPKVPDQCVHNGHLFYLRVKAAEGRDRLMDFLKKNGASAVFHYVPLHLSTMGQKLGYEQGAFPKTEQAYEELLRLPLYCGMTEEEQNHVIALVHAFFGSRVVGGRKTELVGAQ